jgi:phosphosulfolactate phosphohydrolase-like enzyme
MKRCHRQHQVLGAVFVEVHRRSSVIALALNARHRARTEAVVNHRVADLEA